MTWISNFQLLTLYFYVRSLYTQASSRGHEIARALETCPKAVLWKIEFEFCVVMGL